MSNKESGTGGVGFLGLLAILFIGLKLTNVINWSWWTVLSPIWAPFALVIILVALYVFAKCIK